MEVGPDAPTPESRGVGLAHVALKIGTTLDELRAAKAHLEAHGVTKLHLSDHKVSQSIYLSDPDCRARQPFASFSISFRERVCRRDISVFTFRSEAWSARINFFERVPLTM